MKAPKVDGGATIRIGYAEIEAVLVEVLLEHGFSGERAGLCARLFTETTLDGVYSHGLNRFPLFIEWIRDGYVLPGNEPGRVQAVNGFETWDGKLGPGNLNAWFCMGRAIELAGEHGMGVVALHNTTHWLRGGSYGLRAAQAGYIGICMTNTKPNMPPWGGRQPTIGNNPFIIAVPNEPYPVLLDMAMSQFSYGKMEVTQQQGGKLPFAGGFDSEMQLTDDPAPILENELILPAGYWKGSSLAILIDLLVATLSGGKTTPEIGEINMDLGLAQLFMAFDLQRLSADDSRIRAVQSIRDALLGTEAINDGGQVSYPGQITWQRRQENLEKGIPVDRDTWAAIKGLLQR
jgi:3-dehydro-L-gulonate 2-dehydrogenase